MLSTTEAPKYYHNTTLQAVRSFQYSSNPQKGGTLVFASQLVLRSDDCSVPSTDLAGWWFTLYGGKEPSNETI